MSEAIELSYDVMYNLDFQRSVLKLLCENTRFATNYVSVLKEEYFETQPIRLLLPLIRDYQLQYEKELTKSDLMVIVDEYSASHGLSSSMVKALREEVQSIFRSYVKSEQFIQDKMIDFCEGQELKYAYWKGLDILQKGGNRQQCMTLVDQALAVGAGQNDGYNFNDIFTVPDIHQKLYDPDQLIKTGFPSWDKAMNGGMAPGELHVIMAPPKTGKSTIGANVGANALRDGKTVFHATLEIKAESVLMKYAQILSGMSEDDIINVDRRIFDFKIKKYEKIKPNLHVNYWVENTANTMMLRSWICRVRAKTNVTPDLIIIDYDDCLIPTSGSTDSMYENAGVVYADLISLADYFKCPILTFAQPQRDAWNKVEEQEKTISSSELAHSARKAHRCTSISTLNFNKSGDNGYLYVDINRRGESNVKVPLHRELERARFEEIVRQTQ